MAGENGSVRDIEALLWEVPITQLMQLRHYKLRANGAWTIERPQCAADVHRALDLASAQPPVEW